MTINKFEGRIEFDLNLTAPEVARRVLKEFGEYIFKDPAIEGISLFIRPIIDEPEWEEIL